jgi:hypothetical protein
MSGLRRLSQLWNAMQTCLFPVLEDELGALDEKHTRFVAVCETLAPQEHMRAYLWVGNGCPPKSRLALCQAFIAKAVWGFPTTRDLMDAIRHRPALRRLCGWESLCQVPSEATFSRAFAAFAQDALAQRIQETLIKARYGDKIAGHVSRDATAIHAREKGTPKPEPEPKVPQKRGRPRHGESRPLAPPTRMEQQLERDLETNVAELPMVCNWGTKKDSKGKKQTWRGYKLHLDVIDGDIPVSWLLTAASLHDSQVAIPLAQMTDERVKSLYDLADAAYDAPAIRQMSARLGHVAIIDHNPRGGKKREFSPSEAVRYRERTSVERVNGYLHDNHGGRHVRVRGAAKVAAHLSFGLLVIAAQQLLKLVS